MIADTDLDAAFDLDDFAVRGQFTTTGGAVMVNGYFSAGSDAIEQYGVTVEAVEPSFTCRSSAITGVSRGDSLEVQSSTYTVQRIQTIGNGVSVCYLK